jgi:1,2-diacylglycerol 3-alpha-glucosyltransferase
MYLEKPYLKCLDREGMSMRIAMFTNNYKPFIGGVPISIERLANGLRSLGHIVYIFAPEYETRTEDETYIIRYKTFQKKMKNGFVYPNSFDPAIEEKFTSLCFDVIHVHHPMMIGQTALYLSKKYQIPLAYTYHTRYEEYLHYFKFFEKIERDIEKNISSIAIKKAENKMLLYSKSVLVPKLIRIFTNNCDLVFAPTKMMKENLIERGTRTPIEVLPTGLLSSSFIEDEKKSEEIRRKYKNGKKYLLCTTARLEREKNLEFLLRGIAELKIQLEGCFQVLILGDGKQRKELEELVKQLEIEDVISFIGSVPNEEIKDYQFASDLFLFSSKSETQGIVLLEAMAARNPVIAVKASGVVDVVENGKNGFMTEENISEWAKAAADVLVNPFLYDSLKEGAKYTAEQYQTREIAHIAQEVYKEMIQEKQNNKKNKKWSYHYEKGEIQQVIASIKQLFVAS